MIVSHLTVLKIGLLAGSSFTDLVQFRAPNVQGCLYVMRLFVFQRLMCRYRYKHVVTFGGWKEDFMLVVNQSIMRGGNTVEQGTQRLLFVMSRGKVILNFC